MQFHFQLLLVYLDLFIQERLITLFDEMFSIMTKIQESLQLKRMLILAQELKQTVFLNKQIVILKLTLL